MKTLPLVPPQTAFELSVQTAFRQVQIPDAGGQRPMVNLLTGQVFFDTLLGKPVWWAGNGWVDAMGTAV